jgi:glycosyltransferase involved in cell wall biosynthesis
MEPGLKPEQNRLRHCYEINLQTGVGGGEIYTRFFTSALSDLGWAVTLITKRGSWLARNMRMPGVHVVEVDGLEDVPTVLAADNAPVFSHNPFAGAVADKIRQSHRLIFFAHMPLYGRNPAPFAACDLILAVSQHVIDSLKAAGLHHCYPDPLYGVADLARGEDTGRAIRRGSLYDWDTRKFRDRLLSVVYPLAEMVRRKEDYPKRPGLTLGIVSRLTPIKQFPLLFTYLAPILAKHPSINLEIFGSGGYASVRDLRRALRPIATRVRYWGHQHDVGRIYRALDFLLTGLPEKEALGLNVLEAQLAGTPVIAVKAPPFTETVVDGKTGYLYTDPREDNGRSFDALLAQIEDSPERPNPLLCPEHLEKFSVVAFRERLGCALATLGEESS